MDDKRILILRGLLEAFEQKAFDLDAWKIKASIVLKKIFGVDDEKIDLISRLHYDYSSWALRDHSGGKQHDSVADQAKEIIGTAILELELSNQVAPFHEVLKKYLTGAEYEKLQSLLDNNALNTDELTEYFSKITASTKDLILAQIVLKVQ